MRTTLDIDEDVLDVAREIAVHRKQSIGRVISEVFRSSLRTGASDQVVNGVHIIPRPAGSGAVVTLEMVNKLRDEE